MRQYARKQFLRKKNPGDDQYLLKKFDEEITNLKRLSHQHLVSLIGSYTDQKSVAYLMEPIAECNFMTYLCQPRTFIAERLPSLRNYFGCLASAVAYLHRQRVRHRDLKPQNILIKHHEIYITDFGNALDWSKKGRDTTNDSNAPFTEQYVAPEIAKRSSSSRSSASDVWSLGVVFVEMIKVLRGKPVRELRRYLETHGTRHPSVWGNAPATHKWFELIQQVSTGPDSDNEPLMWIKDMTQANPPNRPSSGAIAKQIRNTAARAKFIGHCCAIDDESEAYPSPPSSNHSDDDADLRFDDLPPELDFGEKAYGSLVESAQQSKIEKWLIQDDSVPDVALGLSNDFDESIIDVPYDIVMDDPTTITMIQDAEAVEIQSSWTDRFITLDVCDGYDIVQNDSDSEGEDRPELGGHGYQVMEDSSESEASTVRPMQSRLDDTVQDNTNPNSLSIGYEVVSVEDIRAIEAHLDSLSEEYIDIERQERSILPSSAEPSSETQVQVDSGSTPLQVECLAQDCLISAKPLAEADMQISAESEFSRNRTLGQRTHVSPKPVSMEEVQDESIESPPLITNKVPSRGRVHFLEWGAIRHHNEIPTTSHQDDVKGVGLPSTPKQSIMKSIMKKALTPASRSASSSRSTVKPLNAANLAKLTDRSVEPSATLVASKPNIALWKAGSASIFADKSYISPSVYMQEVWEAASSVPTSIMSERTSKILDSFGSGLAWQDKTAHYLEKYVKAGNGFAVRELLKAGCNPGTKDKPRIRPLMLAVKGGSQRHNKCAQLLLAAGANVNAREKSGKTALHYAIEHENFCGYTNLIRDLLEAGADSNNEDKSGDFPLLQILYGGYEPLKKHKRDALACLLRPEFATDVNVMPPGTLNMPLHLAVRRKDPWAVSMLLTRGANVNEPNGSGMTPLMLAANGWGFTVLTGQIEVLRFLLEAGVNVKEQNELGWTALHFAAATLCEGAVKLLLSKGADSNIADKEGRRPYFYATVPAAQIKKKARAHGAILQMLFGSSGYSELATIDDECPVVTAVVESRIQDARFLLDHGAQVNHCYDSLEKTPLLHVALRNRDFAISRLFIDRGAYIDLQDQNGRDALAVCASMKQTEFATQITEYMNKFGKREMTLNKSTKESVDQNLPEPTRPDKNCTQN